MEGEDPAAAELHRRLGEEEDLSKDALEQESKVCPGAGCNRRVQKVRCVPVPAVHSEDFSICLTNSFVVDVIISFVSIDCDPKGQEDMTDEQQVRCANMNSVGRVWHPTKPSGMREIQLTKRTASTTLTTCRTFRLEIVSTHARRRRCSFRRRLGGHA